MSAQGGSRWPGHYYVFPAVTMYVAAFEAFLQEELALAEFRLADRSDSQAAEWLNSIGAMKRQSDQFREFKDWVKGVFELFDRQGVGVNPDSTEFQNLLALKELRNSVVHYNPSFIEHAVWPIRLEQALHRSKLEVLNAGWVTNFSQVSIADWAHETVKAIVELFCELSSLENPFTTTDADGLLNWEHPGTNVAPPSRGGEDA
jgi:hypothetical protein